MYPLKFKKTLVEKVWGGHQFKNILNFSLNEDRLYGESWEISCHKNGLSYVENGEFKGYSLNELFKIYGSELVGEEIKLKYKDSFPILIKYLDINDKLSVQVHPDDSYALKIEKELGKSEVWYVMEASDDAKLILGLKEFVTPEIFKEKIQKRELKDIFNIVSVKKGDFIDVKPGVVHGTLEGSILICEIQQNSDTTYRIYDFDREINGKKRELHMDKAMDVIDFGKSIFVSSEKTREKIICDNVEKQILIRGEYFSVDKLLITKNFIDKPYKNFKIYSILNGDGVFICNDKQYKVKKGETYFIPANMEMEIIGKIEMIKTYI